MRQRREKFLIDFSSHHFTTQEHVLGAVPNHGTQFPLINFCTESILACKSKWKGDENISSNESDKLKRVINEGSGVRAHRLGLLDELVTAGNLTSCRFAVAAQASSISWRFVAFIVHYCSACPLLCYSQTFSPEQLIGMVFVKVPCLLTSFSFHEVLNTWKILIMSMAPFRAHQILPEDWSSLQHPT